MMSSRNFGVFSIPASWETPILGAKKGDIMSELALEIKTANCPIFDSAGVCVPWERM